MNNAPGKIGSVGLYTLDHGCWEEVRANLLHALEAHHLAQLATPTTFVLNDLLDCAVKAMHLQLFRQIMETGIGLQLEGNDEQLETLYRAELKEHGFQNITHACKTAGWQVLVNFPVPAASSANTLVQVDAPFPWNWAQCQTKKLIDVLGFQLETENSDKCYRVALVKRADRQQRIAAPFLLCHETQLASLWQIFSELDYSLVHFTPVGEIISVSPSLLDRLGLDQQEASAHALAEAIPFRFHKDITWGLALAEAKGVFENYRVRVRLPYASNISILFNVSGFRRSDGTIHSLWQAVSEDKNGIPLAEGSILSEVRIHNITRNYVPQLVEQKARESVTLGKTSLSNEERPVTVLFCDIVGFTSYVEHNADSESIIDTLNSILRRVSGSVMQNNGYIDKFMGDCIMALFDKPSDAVLSAINMQDHSEDINSLRSRAGQQPLQLRIGIHWGQVVIGNVGTAERLDWTAIGDVVNTASRIEKGCQPGSILISQAVRDAIESAQPGQFKLEETFGLQVKGKQDALVVCYVKGTSIKGDIAA